MSSVSKLLLLSSLLVGYLAVATAGNFFQDTTIYMGGNRARILNGGNMIALSLDRGAGSGFRSNTRFLFGKFSIRLKLVAGNSAGTVASFYLQSPGQGYVWDEIDFEFLGNLSGQPYKLHTNVFTGSRGMREQQFFLWFDPTADFHTYTILWNPRQIAWYVDGTPVRVFKNLESMGIPFPKSQPMYLYGSLWNGEDWATRGGKVRTDWSKAPFVATFANYVAEACAVSWSGASTCTNAPQWYYQQMDAAGMQQIRGIQNRYMVYNFCKDPWRFPRGFPRDCFVTQ